MEGETGVSKTALTRMLFILKNHPNLAQDDDGIGDEIRGQTLRRTIDQSVAAHQEAASSRHDVTHAQADGECLRIELERTRQNAMAAAAAAEAAAAAMALAAETTEGKAAEATEVRAREESERARAHAVALEARVATQAAELARFEAAALSAMQKVSVKLLGYNTTDRPLPEEVWSDLSKLCAYICSYDGTRMTVDQMEHAALLRDALVGELKRDPGLCAHTKLWKCVQEANNSNLLTGFLPPDRSPLAALLRAYVEARVQSSAEKTSWIFHQLNVHAALTPREIVADLMPMLDLGDRLLDPLFGADGPLKSDVHTKVRLCIFLDEVNTSSTMGLFKELISDHRLEGRDLPPNIVIIAACNPAREKLVFLSAANARREELGKMWAMGHYQVRPLPLSIEQVVWDYGSLTPEQESEFVKKRLAILHGNDESFPVEEQLELAELICRAQALTRLFAEEVFNGLMAFPR